MARLKREKVHIIFLQETHLSRREHEKLKRFGFKNTYYLLEYVQSHRRGIAILVTNKVKFESYKEKKIRRADILL